MNSFSIIYVEQKSPNLTIKSFKRARKNWVKELNPTKWVKVTGIDHMETTFDIEVDCFHLTFSVHWEDKNQ